MTATLIGRGRDAGNEADVVALGVRMVVVMEREN